jgi:nucleoside phosphorylase
MHLCQVYSLATGELKMSVETDILVCGPTPVEHQQVRDFVAAGARGSGEKENEFTISRPDKEQRPARVTCVTLGDMGPDAVDAPLHHFLDLYRPKLVLLTGIAGVSLRSNLTVGDVVIASDISNHLIVHYGLAGAKADIRSVPIVAQTRTLLASLSSVQGEFLKSIRRRLDVASIQPPQLEAMEIDPDFKYLDDLKYHRQEVDSRFKRASRGDRRFKAAKFASSGAFHKNPNIAHEITQNDIDRDCFDMESVRVMNVCFEKHIPAIMIKAISDIVGFKTKQSSRYARNVAGATIASLLFESREFWKWFDHLVTSAPRPIPIYERETIPLQPLVGRRDALQRALALAAAGNNVVISGPPGIGKTRLLEEIRRARQPNTFVRLEQGGRAVRDIRLALHRASRAPFPLDDDEGIDLVRRNLDTELLLLVDNADSDESAQGIFPLFG